MKPHRALFAPSEEPLLHAAERVRHMLIESGAVPECAITNGEETKHTHEYIPQMDELLLGHGRLHTGRERGGASVDNAVSGISGISLLTFRMQNVGRLVVRWNPAKVMRPPTPLHEALDEEMKALLRKAGGSLDERTALGRRTKLVLVAVLAPDLYRERLIANTMRKRTSVTAEEMLETWRQRLMASARMAVDGSQASGHPAHAAMIRRMTLDAETTEALLQLVQPSWWNALQRLEQAGGDHSLPWWNSGSLPLGAERGFRSIVQGTFNELADAEAMHPGMAARTDEPRFAVNQLHWLMVCALQYEALADRLLCTPAGLRWVRDVFRCAAQLLAASDAPGSGGVTAVARPLLVPQTMVTGLLRGGAPPLLTDAELHAACTITVVDRTAPEPERTLHAGGEDVRQCILLQLLRH